MSVYEHSSLEDLLCGRTVGLHRTPVLHGQTVGRVCCSGHALHGPTNDACGFLVSSASSALGSPLVFEPGHPRETEVVACYHFDSCSFPTHSHQHLLGASWVFIHLLEGTCLFQAPFWSFRLGWPQGHHQPLHWGALACRLLQKMLNAPGAESLWGEAPLSGVWDSPCFTRVNQS